MNEWSCNVCQRELKGACSDESPCCSSEQQCLGSSAAAGLCCPSVGRPSNTWGARCTSAKECTCGTGYESLRCVDIGDGRGPTCQKCRAGNEKCTSDDICCSGRCQDGTCLSTLGGACSPARGCGPGLRCLCGVCIEEPPGPSDKVPWGSAETKQCLCIAGTGDQNAKVVVYADNTYHCAVSACFPCAHGSDCAVTHSECRPDYKDTTESKLVTRCCGLADAICTKDEECCTGHRCQYNAQTKKSRCVIDSKANPTFCGSKPGCSPEGAACGSNSPGCCENAGLKCTNGVCAVGPETYRALGFEIFPCDSGLCVNSKPVYDIPLPVSSFGVPKALAVGPTTMVYVAAGGTKNQLIVIDMDPSVNKVKFVADLAEPPVTLDMTQVVGPEEVADLMVGGPGQVTHYVVNTFQSKVTAQKTLALPNGAAVAGLSPQRWPLLSDSRVTAVTSGGPPTTTNLLLSLDVNLNTPKVIKSVVVAQYGTPVDLVAGEDRVFYATSGTKPTLVSQLVGGSTPIGTASLQGTPNLVDGAALLPKPPYVLVTTRGDQSSEPRAWVFNPDTLKLAFVHSLAGDAVALQATAIGSSSWIATRTPNKVLTFNPNIAASPSEVLDLTQFGEPVAMIVKATGPASDPGNDPCGSDSCDWGTAMVHLVVR